MNTRAWLPIAALLGALIAVAAVVDMSRAPQVPVSAPATAMVPYASYVAGTGLTEIGRGNIAVGTPVAGIVSGVPVRVGEAVQAGQLLFRIDDRDLQARLPVARAQVAEAAAALAKPEHRLRFLAHLQQADASAVSAQMLSDLRDDAAAATATLAAARAQVDQLQADIARRRVLAPVAGRVLQVNIRVGEFVAGGTPPPLLLGDDRRIYLRVDIDESDAWRVDPQAPAVAFVRGNPAERASLRFEYLEPVVQAKTALSGQGTERSDVRVLQAIYSFARGGWPVYLGEQMDVFIQAPPLPGDGHARLR